ncbi:WbqC family protein [Terasakiella sp.]|uniref:WbqC family protein n=1 Tax=Terasakiella sp. TaxID=2034861 RepID=UPI003AA8158C
MNKVVAIHQPNFFPWLGYFDKICRSDAFIFLDHVQFPKKQGCWVNRVKLSIAGDARWITANVDRNYHGTRSINEMSYRADQPWRRKFSASLKSAYARHTYFSEIYPLVEELILSDIDNVAEYNIKAITTLLDQMSISRDHIYRSSELNIKGSSNELLCNLTQSVGGNVYMCGGGAEEYQDEDVFISHQLELREQGFVPRAYPQFGNDGFIAGLSIIDALMNMGWQGTAAFLQDSP